ncbi:hypothetical protein [Lactococcus lactis]|uniref:hypothetical protein n=1 Tax=Lactococcus lactis TaxID=1358 RepID=UPI002078D83B|nr:hypothetical protein [Lactococcus lactis]USI47169.1 hypothetical protein M5C73_07240 [Lactococcus lactis]
MFIFLSLILGGAIYGSVKYWLHKEKPIRNVQELLQIDFIIYSIFAIIISVLIIVFCTYFMILNKSLDNLPWIALCVLVIIVAALFFKENKI